MDKSGGKINVFVKFFTPYVNLIQPFGIPIGRFQNISSKALTEGSILGYFKCSKQ